MDSENQTQSNRPRIATRILFISLLSFLSLVLISTSSYDHGDSSEYYVKGIESTKLQIDKLGTALIGFFDVGNDVQLTGIEGLYYLLLVINRKS